MLTIATHLIGSISNRRTRYIALFAVAALLVCAAVLGFDQTDD